MYTLLTGFARYAPRDAQAPTAPTGLDVQGSPGQVSVQWAGIAESGVDYEILENGRVVAVTTGTSAVLPLPQATASYAVRAVDPAGNDVPIDGIPAHVARSIGKPTGQSLWINDALCWRCDPIHRSGSRRPKAQGIGHPCIIGCAIV